jgi:hypothetical protein
VTSFRIVRAHPGREQRRVELVGAHRVDAIHVHVKDEVDERAPRVNRGVRLGTPPCASLLPIRPP